MCIILNAPVKLVEAHNTLRLFFCYLFLPWEEMQRLWSMRCFYHAHVIKIWELKFDWRLSTTYTDTAGFLSRPFTVSEHSWILQSAALLRFPRSGSNPSSIPSWNKKTLDPCMLPKFGMYCVSSTLTVFSHLVVLNDLKTQQRFFYFSCSLSGWARFEQFLWSPSVTTSAQFLKIHWYSQCRSDGLLQMSNDSTALPSQPRVLPRHLWDRTEKP